MDSSYEHFEKSMRKNWNGQKADGLLGKLSWNRDISIHFVVTSCYAMSLPVFPTPCDPMMAIHGNFVDLAHPKVSLMVSVTCNAGSSRLSEILNDPTWSSKKICCLRSVALTDD